MSDNNDMETGSEQSQPSAPSIEGVVKWFDPVKGFGFVVADSGGPDILLHVNVLRNFGQSSVADGARIELEAQQTNRGVQATAVLAIHPPEGAQTVALADIVGLEDAAVASTPLEPARVKWFDKAKGFGFANVFGKPDEYGQFPDQGRGLEENVALFEQGYQFILDHHRLDKILL